MGVFNFLLIPPPCTYSLIVSIVNAAAVFGRIEFFSFLFHNHRKMCCFMVLIDDVNTQMWYNSSDNRNTHDEVFQVHYPI